MPGRHTTPSGVIGWRLGLVAALLLGSCATVPKAVERVPSHAFDGYATTDLGRQVAAMQPRADASGFRLLVSGDAAYRARLILVDRAQASLDLQYYVVEPDATTRELFAHIRQASERGVRVRLLLDDLNTVSHDGALARFATNPNVEVRLFNPFPAARASLASRFLVAAHDFRRLTRRMHNKLLVADNTLAVTGGRNLGAAYFGSSGDVGFADLDVLAAGPVVRELSTSFDRFWNSRLTYPITALAEPRTGDEAARGTPAVPPPDSPRSAGRVAVASAEDPLRRLVWAPAHVLADHPGKIVSTGVPPAGSMLEDALAIVRRARHRVCIVSPYVIPGPDVTEALREVRSRGVAVDVLTNSLVTTDMVMAHAAYARHRVELLALGVGLHELRAAPERRDGLLRGSSRWSKPSLHAKAIVVDERWVVVGSMNLDRRSALENTEAGLVIDSPELGAHLGRLLAQAMQPEASYSLRLEPDGSTIQWVTRDAGVERVRLHEPEAGLWRNVASVLLRVSIPDEPL